MDLARKTDSIPASGPPPLLSGNTTSPWAIAAAQKLDTLGKLEPGWDSYDGLPLQPAARELAVRVFHWLACTEMPAPGISLGSGGTVHLEWRNNGRELELELVDQTTIHFAAVTAEGEIQEEGEATTDLPEKLAALTNWLLEGTE